nr:MAG TPA: hypothetical protein [Caudoviricetes sp.]
MIQSLYKSLGIDSLNFSLPRCSNNYLLRTAKVQKLFLIANKNNLNSIYGKLSNS